MESLSAGEIRDSIERVFYLGKYMIIYKVEIIKFLLKRNDISIKEIAYFFDVNKDLIYDIKRNKNWKNI